MGTRVPKGSGKKGKVKTVDEEDMHQESEQDSLLSAYQIRCYTKSFDGTK